MINTALLAEICKVAGAPGHEQKVREIVLREVESLVDEIRIDNMGNIMAIKKGKESKKVMIGGNDIYKTLCRKHFREITKLI